MAVEKVGVCFRVDRVLHAQLTAEAKRAERSLARELIWRLRRSLDEHRTQIRKRMEARYGPAA